MQCLLRFTIICCAGNFDSIKSFINVYSGMTGGKNIRRWKCRAGNKFSVIPIVCVSCGRHWYTVNRKRNRSRTWCSNTVLVIKQNIPGDDRVNFIISDVNVIGRRGTAAQCGISLHCNNSIITCCKSRYNRRRIRPWF